MCGCTKISGMKRRKKSARRSGRKSYRRRSARMGALPKLNNVMDVAVTGATVLGGIAIANKVKSIGFLANNPLIGNLAVIAVGALTPSLLKNATGARLGAGMAVAGVRGLLMDNAPGIADTLGIAGLESNAPVFSMMNGLESPAPTSSYIGETLRLRVA